MLKKEVNLVPGTVWRMEKKGDRRGKRSVTVEGIRNPGNSTIMEPWPLCIMNTICRESLFVLLKPLWE